MEDHNPYAALSALSDDVAELAHAIAPRVITIDVGGRRMATGTVWRDDVVVTTAHAIRDPEKMSVISREGAPRPAVFGGWDLGTDLAVLKVEGMKRAETVGDTGEAAGAMRVGQLAVVLAGTDRGAPVARLTMIAGIGPVDRLRRGTRLDRVIELDIAPFPGYSGGPLADTHGRVVAINTSGIARGAALGLPINLVAQVVEKLLVHGRVARGYLGVGMHAVNVTRADKADASTASGLLIHSLDPTGPAQRAGALVGDILVSIEGKPLDTPMRLLEELSGERVGESVRLGVIRGGNSTEIAAVIGERPSRTTGRHRRAR